MQFLYGVWSHYLLQTWWPDQPPLQDILQGLQQCRSSSDVPRNLTHILNTQEPDTHFEHTIQFFLGFWQPTFLYWPIPTWLKSFNLEVKLVHPPVIQIKKSKNHSLPVSPWHLWETFVLAQKLCLWPLRRPAQAACSGSWTSQTELSPCLSFPSRCSSEPDTCENWS